MEAPEFGGLLLIVTVAFLAPFLLGLAPGLRLPSVVFEIVAGIVIGPSVLGWVEIDQTIEVLSLVGLAVLLFLAGLEIDFSQLRGHVLRLAVLGWEVSLALAVALGLALAGAGLVETPLLVAVILSATSLGVIIPVLKDAGELESRFGQLVLGAASIADFGAVIPALAAVFYVQEDPYREGEYGAVRPRSCSGRCSSASSPPTSRCPRCCPRAVTPCWSIRGEPLPAEPARDTCCVAVDGPRADDTGLRRPLRTSLVLRLTEVTERQPTPAAP